METNQKANMKKKKKTSHLKLEGIRKWTSFKNCPSSLHWVRRSFRKKISYKNNSAQNKQDIASVFEPNKKYFYDPEIKQIRREKLICSDHKMNFARENNLLAFERFNLLPQLADRWLQGALPFSKILDQSFFIVKLTQFPLRN